MTQQEPTATSVIPVLRRKIPISLSVVSYIFFTIGLIVVIRSFAGLVIAKTDLTLVPLIMLILGILYLFLSRGLRRCSRKWYICALVVASCRLLYTIYQVVHYFLSHAADTTGTLPYRFVFAVVLGVLIQAWILQVLTRADIRRLFCGGHEHAV
jgi:hypothetical protein